MGRGHGAGGPARGTPRLRAPVRQRVRRCRGLSGRSAGRPTRRAATRRSRRGPRPRSRRARLRRGRGRAASAAARASTSSTPASRSSAGRGARPCRARPSRRRSPPAGGGPSRSAGTSSRSSWVSTQIAVRRVERRRRRARRGTRAAARRRAPARRGTAPRVAMVSHDIADRDREARGRADPAQRRRVLARAEDDEPGPVRRATSMSAPSIAAGRSSRGARWSVEREPRRMAAPGLRDAVVPRAAASAMTAAARLSSRRRRDRRTRPRSSTAASQRGPSAAHPAGSARADRRHLDAAAAGESCGVGGLVAEAEAARAAASAGEGGVRERDGLGLDASARDRADDPPVAGDRHRRAGAARRAARDARDRDAATATPACRSGSRSRANSSMQSR